mmetsp:Transcript_9923/g.21428  ORF Transcript_9923/g.21428 Transcript_9923/m.21428 type:complete len:259 (+) Transcript_9923:3191-3967(+)
MAFFVTVFASGSVALSSDDSRENLDDSVVCRENLDAAESPFRETDVPRDSRLNADGRVSTPVPSSSWVFSIGSSTSRLRSRPPPQQVSSSSSVSSGGSSSSSLPDSDFGFEPSTGLDDLNVGSIISGDRPPSPLRWLLSCVRSFGREVDNHSFELRCFVRTASSSNFSSSNSSGCSGSSWIVCRLLLPCICCCVISDSNGEFGRENLSSPDTWLDLPSVSTGEFGREKLSSAVSPCSDFFLEGDLLELEGDARRSIDS